MYTPKNLKLWTMPSDYVGEVWPGYFVFLGQHRDSDSVDRSNFIRGLELIGGESETVQVVRERHWAVGWIEWIAIHQDDDAALEKADEIAKRLDSYPVVDDDHLSALEWEEAQDYWERSSIRERVELCQRAEVSIFAARRDWLPNDDVGYLLDLLRV